MALPPVQDGLAVQPVASVICARGMPVGVLKAGSRRSPSCRAFSRKTASPERSQAASRPPSTRIVTSKTEMAPCLLKSSFEATHSRASANSSFMPMTQSVSSESTSVMPRPDQLLSPPPLRGLSSSMPQACSR